MQSVAMAVSSFRYPLHLWIWRYMMHEAYPEQSNIQVNVGSRRCMTTTLVAVAGRIWSIVTSGRQLVMKAGRNITL